MTAVLMVVGLMPTAAAAATGTIKGNVSAPAGTLYDGWIELHKWDPRDLQWDYMEAASVNPSNSYAFAFANLDVGAEYTLFYEGYGSYSGAYPPDQAFGKTPFDENSRVPAQVIKLTSASQTVSFALSPGVEVKGKVVVPSGVTGPVFVSLYAPRISVNSGVFQHDGARQLQRVEVGADGSYSFPRVLPGADYSVAVEGRGNGNSSLHEPVSLTGTGTYEGSRAFRRITAATTLPTVTMCRTVPVTGKFVAPEGVTIAGAKAWLIEVDPAGYIYTLVSTTVGADGSFTFPQGAFPDRQYTVRLDSGSGFYSTYPGLTVSSYAALPYRAGSAGLTIPDVPVLVTGMDWVTYRDVYLRGMPAVGQTLEVWSGNGVPGASSASPGASFTYVWYRDREIIPGATGPRYTLTTADLGHAVSATAVIRAPGLRSMDDSTSSVVINQGAAPFATTYPALSGTAKVGSRLTVSKGSWSVSNVKLAYQWARDGVAIPGATSTSYVLQAQDRGKRLSVRISASAPGLVTGMGETAPSAPVALGDAAKAKKKPKISGTARVGKKLKVSKGTWSLPGVSISYQWLRNGKKIKKATAKTYKVKKKDLRKRISVRVTVKKSGYKSATVVTKKTKKVKAKK